MDLRARWNIAQWKRVAHQNVRLRPAHNLLPHLQPFWLNDVALLAIGIRQQRDARRAVGIVLNGRYCGRNPSLVALEIDDAQLALVSAATVPDRDIARVTASAGALLRLDQRFVRMLAGDVVIDDR